MKGSELERRRGVAFRRSAGTVLGGARMNDHHSFALTQLDRVSEQGPRAEAKVSALLPVAVAMLAIVALGAPVKHPVSWLALAAVAASICLVMCLLRIYETMFPRLNASGSSLIFFGEAAKLDEAAFRERFTQLNETALLTDAATQVWRTSAIVSAKYAKARAAFHWLAYALIPWLAFLVLVTVQQGKVPVLGGG
jgi:hypothetical protein